MEKWKEIFLDNFIKSWKDANEGKILKEALDRLKLATRVPCSTPDERFSSRLEIPRPGLSVDASNVIEDVHTIFRVVSKSLLYREDSYDIIRMCLDFKLEIDINTLRNAGKDFTFVSLCKNKIRQNESCLEIWPAIIQECANLFQVTFYCIRADVDKVDVLAPKGLNAQSKKDIWLIASPVTLKIWNTALPRGTTAPPPKDTFHIMSILGGKNATKVVEMCRDMVEGEGTPVVNVPAATNTETEFEKFIRISAELKLVTTRVEVFGFTNVDLGGIGNCMFLVMSRCLLRNEKHDMLARQLIVTWITSRFNEYEKYCVTKPGEEQDDYLIRMKNQEEWGSQGFYQTLADLFHLKVVCFVEYPNKAVIEYFPESGFFLDTIRVSQTSNHAMFVSGL